MDIPTFSRFYIEEPVYGPTVDFGVGLLVGASCDAFNASCTSNVNFIDTLQITGAQLFDANGNLIPDASFISESGFNPNAVPEPSSFLLLGSGLLGIATIYRRRSLSNTAVAS
jgi:hypothetical protein